MSAPALGKVQSACQKEKLAEEVQTNRSDTPVGAAAAAGTELLLGGSDLRVVGGRSSSPIVPFGFVG